jgi:serine/threonine protein kinase
MEVPLKSFRKRFTYDPVKDLLGKGGFGEVYKAYDNEDQLFVALKIAQGTTNDKYNLINEIRRFKMLNHPNIVKHIEAYEVNTGGTDIHGNPIIHHVGILEYADQGTFADLLKKGTNYRQIEDIAKDIIDGLAYLHSEGIIHRDLKPTNILLFSEGEKLRAKITDFGIAKRTDATAASTQLVGTVEYMAPEYFTTGNITPASDVWSIGVMLLEALTGSHPFGKTTQGLNNQQIINQILNKDISSAIQPLNAPFKDMITRCLLRDTNLRPQSANELKGLFMEGGYAFTESTQILVPKTAILSKETQEPKWKRWGKALFDFKVRRGAWKKLLAKELTLAFLFIPLFIITLLIFLAAITPYRVLKENELKVAIDSSTIYLNNNIEYKGKLLAFSKRYFYSHSSYPEDDPIFYTGLGEMYDIFRDTRLRSKYKKQDLDYFDIETDYYDNSYVSFVAELKKMKKYEVWNFERYEKQVKIYNEINNTSWDLADAFNSVNNFDLEVPKDNSDNYLLYRGEVSYFWFKFDLKQIIEKGNVTWFYNYRVSKTSGLTTMTVSEFDKFITKCFEYEEIEIKTKQLEQSIGGYNSFTDPLDWQEEGFSAPEWIIIFLLSLVYPIRFFLAISYWAYKNLAIK